MALSKAHISAKAQKSPLNLVKRPVISYLLPYFNWICIKLYSLIDTSQLNTPVFWYHNPCIMSWDIHENVKIFPGSAFLLRSTPNVSGVYS